MLRKAFIFTVGLLMLAPVALSAGETAMNPVELLFNSRHMDLVPKENEVQYKFERTGSDEKLLGQNFTDNVRVGVKNVGEKGERDIKVTVFSGERQRPVVEHEALTINPIFIWFLDRSVDNYRLMSGGSQPYLKGMFSRSFSDAGKTTTEPTKLEFNGKTVDAIKITVLPYKDDAAKDKMQGFEVSKFTIIVSKDVPGYFHTLVAHIESTQKGTSKVEEKVSMVSLGAVK